MSDKKILVSGVKPTGKLHIGNYFGALKQFVDLQDTYKARIFIADLHALTSVQNGKELSDGTFNILLDYLAIGLDPEKVILYKQSDIPEVTELAWILNTMMSMPYLMRAHAFKDAEAKNKDINIGVFDYPVLMAADILLSGAHVVPVGKDQKQHVEIARDLAEKFNRVFGETFILPKELIIEDTQTVPGTDGQKMSKSYNNVIPLFATDEEIEKSVMSIVTDSSSDIPKNVYAIHSLFRNKESLDALYEDKKGKYKDLKEALMEDLKVFISPLREKRNQLLNNRDQVLKVLTEGKAKIRPIVEAKMSEVRAKVGLTQNQ